MASSSQPKDFLSTVEEFLDRGQVYRPPDEFVKQLALCPRCIGGKDQCKVLEATLLRMTSLVKSRLNEPGRRNVTSFLAWLKNAAKAMELYQVISREWICENVWKLPDLPQRKEQDYDPTRGRKDIRYYPVSETKLLELSEEEKMEISSLPCDEDQLLSLSPTKVQEEKASYSPRRSPRLLTKTTIQISPKKKSVSRKEPQEPRQVDDHFQTCSQGRSPRKESQRGLMDDQSQTCSQGRRSPRKESQRGLMDARSQTCSQGRRSPRKESQRGLMDDRSQACSQGERSQRKDKPVRSDRVVTCSQTRRDQKESHKAIEYIEIGSIIHKPTRSDRVVTCSQTRRDQKESHKASKDIEIGSDRVVTCSQTRRDQKESHKASKGIEIGSDRVVTCSQTRRDQKESHKASEDIKMGSVTQKSTRSDRVMTCSQTRRDQKESHKAKRDTKTGSPKARSVLLAKRSPGSLQVVCSTDGERIPKQKKLSIMSQTEACSSGQSDRHVQIVEGSPINILKRPAPGRKEELVISTSVLKKTRTEDIVSQVRQKADEGREIEVMKREKRPVQRCWVPGCTGDSKYLKAHAYYDHIPSIFDERLQPTDEQVLRGRRNALKQAGRWLLGRPVELDELVAFVVIQKMLSQTDNTEITQRQETAMREFCKFLYEPVPDKFVLEPCNSTAVLLHWKALLLIAASLGEEEREYWLKTFKTPEETLFAVPVKVHPDAMDSHFHLDRTLRDMHLSPQGSLDEIINNVSVDEDEKINLVCAVAIYCDPRTYPTERYLQQIPQHIYVGLGFHPKHAKNTPARIEDEVHQFQRLIKNPRVVAFGEIGLDHSEPMKYWANQVELLQKLLPFLEDRHVLVIHCRGMHGDCGTEAFLLLLHFLRKYVRSHQPVHLHCFTGNKYVVERWLEVFPRTFFGFTNLVNKFDEHQIAALCSLEESRLLLESDSPYFPVKDSRVSSPSQLWAVAAAVASHRQLTPERVLEVSLANGQHLYCGQQ